MERYVKAWGFWLAGAVTVLLGMYVLSRHLYAPDELELDDES